MFKNSIYKINEDSYYNIHILINNYCNNRCVYCWQYDKYWDDEMDLDTLEKIVYFFKNWLHDKQYNFVIEWWEPSFHSKLTEIFYFFQKNKIFNKIIFLSNWRIPRDKFNLFKYYLQNNLLNSIVLHVPLWKEPYHDEWLKDIVIFLNFLNKNNIENKISLVWIIYNKVSSLFLPILLKIWKKYRKLIFNIEPWLAHPSIENRHFLNFQERLDIMKNLYNFFNIADQNWLKIWLWGFMLCLLDSIKNISNEKILNKLYKWKLEMNKNVELHIVLDGSWFISLPIADSKDTYIKLKPIFEFNTFDDYQKYLNEELEWLYNKNYSKLPTQCKDECEHYWKGCNWDHFWLISDYIANK